jgi:lipopolysaccharide/colanic/teichoic acid biosynthesis glycosyltransferase
MPTEMQVIKIPHFKRAFDIVMSSFFILLSLPFVLFLFIWVVIEQIFIKDSRGPLLYREKRVSQGKVFEFYKWRIFKAMVIAEALKNGPVIHTAVMQGDLKNLTYYGRFLKRVYMDELPQLCNVLRGDMTLVGPRPTNLINSENFKKSGDYTREIMMCGITGPFQSQKGHAIMSQIDLDKEYIDFVVTNPGWKVVLKDFKIILQTIKIILEAKGF